MNYAAAIDQTGLVLRVIVGTVDWAVENLGGTWLSLEPDNYAGPGWYWDGHQFIPPDPEPDDADG